MGWVQRDLSEKLGCSQSAVAMWSSGKTSPPYSAILQLIELGATAEELFGKPHADLLDSNGSFKDLFSDKPQQPTIPQELITEGVKKALAELGINTPNK